MRMLYVEDDRLNALLFEQVMRLRDDIELRVAEDGIQAIAMVEDWTPDVLVLDAQLPGTTGFELLLDLRRQPELAQVPALMCSADASEEHRMRSRTAGFVGYWPKPLDVPRVMADLERLCAGLEPR